MNVLKIALEQGSGTYGSRARCGDFDDGIWLHWYFLNTIVKNGTFSVIFHLPDYRVISNTMQYKKHVIKDKIKIFTIV